MHDPFKNKFESRDSIGALRDFKESDVKYRLNLPRYALNSLSIEENTLDEIVGAIVRGEDYECCDEVGDSKKVAADIRSVTRSPVTVAAIGATAAVPVVGPVLAGAASAGLAIAEGVAGVVDEFGGAIEGVVNDVGKALECIFGCSPPKKPLSKAAKAKLKKTNFASVRDKAIKGLAANLSKAKKGDKKAIQAISAIMLQTNPAMMKEKLRLKAVASGVPVKEADKAVKKALATPKAKAELKKLKDVVDGAKKLSKAAKPVKGGLDVKKVKKAIEDGAKLLRKSTDKAAKARGDALDGVFVSLDRKMRKRGKWSNRIGVDNKGSKGFVVLKTGKVVSGRFVA